MRSIFPCVGSSRRISRDRASGSPRRLAPRRRALSASLWGVTLLAAPLLAAQQPARDGVLLLDVVSESPAAQAGLSRGAILLEVAGVTVNDSAELVDVLQDHAGQRVQVRYRFGADIRTTRVHLGDGDDSPLLGVVPEASPGGARLFGGPQFDFQLPPLQRRPFGVDPLLQESRGALVLEVSEDSPAAAAGVVEGDIVTAVDGEAVGANADASAGKSLGQLIEAHQPGDRVELDVAREGETITLSVTLTARPNAGGAYLGVHYRPVRAVSYRFMSPNGSRSEDRERLEERWRDLFRGGAPGRFTERKLLPI